jgi:hypothetical protein
VLGVAGGVRPRAKANGQQPVVDPDLLSASTTLQQSGGGGYARLIDALQSLDQIQNILTLAQQAANVASEIATLQSQVTSINGQIGVINTQIGQLQNAVVSLTSQLGGWSFANTVGAPPAGAVTGSMAATAQSGTQYQLPLYA